MAEYEVLWVAEGVALVQADNKEEAEQSFYDSRDFFMENPDAITVDAVVSPFERH